MEKSHRDCSIRLVIGLLINLAMLKPVVDDIGIGNWSLANGISLQLALIGGASAVFSLVLTTKVFWRGVSWQIITAILLTPIPIVLLFDALRFWLRGY
jgi:hypothetical protein